MQDAGRVDRVHKLYSTDTLHTKHSRKLPAGTRQTGNRGE